MKKLFLMFIMTAFAASLTAQSQLSTVHGKTKDGKTIEVKYYKGAVEDYVESVKYQVIDDLQGQVKSLQADVKTLQGKLDAATKETKELENKAGNGVTDKDLQHLRDQVAEKEAQIDELSHRITLLQTQMDSASRQSDAELQTLRDEIASKNRTIQQLDRQLNANTKGTATPVIGLEGGWGLVFPNIIDNNWKRDLSTSLQAGVYFGTARLSESFPISVEAGAGFRRISMSAHLGSFTNTNSNTIDNDGDACEAICTFNNLSESLRLTYIGIPIRLCFGQPYTTKASLYAKLGVTPSIHIGASEINGDGTYSLKGHYPQWDVTLEDIAELGYGNGFNCYEDSEGNSLVATTINKFNLWGNVAVGAYIPLSKDVPIVLNASLKLDYSILPVGNTSADGTTALPNGHTGLLKDGGRMLIPSVGIGLVYTLK